MWWVKGSFFTHFCLPFCTTLLRDGKGPFRGAASSYPVSWLVTSGAQGMYGIIVFSLRMAHALGPLTVSRIYTQLGNDTGHHLVNINF